MANNPKIILRSNSSQGSDLSNGGATQLGEFVANTTQQIYIFIGNDTSDSTLVIPYGGLAITNSGSLSNTYSAILTNGVLVPSTPTSLPSSISFQKGIFALVAIDTSSVGSKSFTITTQSNDANNSTFTHTFYFTVAAASTTSSTVAIIYNNTLIQNNGYVDVGYAAKSSTQNITIYLANYGVPTLTVAVGNITLTTISGSETFVSNPVATTSVNLSFNQSVAIICGLDTSSIGEKSFVITINSNDAVNNPFVFTVIYTVAESYDLVIKQSTSELSDNDTISLGSITQNSVVSKNISMSNSGILYGIKVTNIISQGSADLLQIPALPIVLEPNESNSFSFVVRVNTASLGQKTSLVQIQWEVSL
jgi:hypothetical protein